MSKQNPIYSGFAFEPDLSAQFLRAGREYEKALHRLGFKTALTRSRDCAIFRAAPLKIQRSTVFHVDFNAQVLNEMETAKENPLDTKLFLWRALKRLHFVPPGDLLGVIEDGDLVEMYSFDEIQIFRSLQFFELTSFTLEEILCLPWYKLTRRNWRPLLGMFRTALKFKTGLLKGVVPWTVAPHEVREVNSPGLVRFHTQLKYIIPLYKNGKPVAAISTNRSVVIARSDGQPF